MKTATLVNRAIMAKLSVSCFGGSMKDKKITSEIQKKHNSNSLTAGKKIFQGEELNKIINLSQALRKQFAALSLPWLDGGIRLIPSAKFVETKQALDKTISDFNQAVAEMVAAYDAMLARDKGALNGAFNLSDYPTKAELAASFSVSLSCSPVPVAQSDWRIAGIDAQTAKDISEQVEKETLERLNIGKAELLTNAKEEIAHLMGKLSDADARFKANSIANVIDSALSISALNVTEDKKLEKLSATLAKAFEGMDADAIREDKKARAVATELCKTSLAAIEETMAGIY